MKKKEKKALEKKARKILKSDTPFGRGVRYFVSLMGRKKSGRVVVKGA